MEVLIPAVQPDIFDETLKNLEHRLWGPGALSFAPWLLGHPLRTDFFCLVYLSLFVWLAATLLYHLFLRRALFQRFMLGLFIVHGVGYLGYLLYPAVGPRFAFPEAWSWLEGGFFFRLTNAVVDLLGSKRDVFPSLHAALSAYLMLWQWRYDTGRLFWSVPWGASIWLSTLVLGYHYLPDLLSGLLLGAVAAWAPIFLEGWLQQGRKKLQPLWLAAEELPEGKAREWGRLAERMSYWIFLGGRPPEGIWVLKRPNADEEEEMRRLLQEIGGEGPFWVRPSDLKHSPARMEALRPLSLAQVMRVLKTLSKDKCFLVQRALKVSRMGLCRAFPKGRGPLGVEFRIFVLPLAEPRLLRIDAQKTYQLLPFFLSPTLPIRFLHLVELFRLVRRLADRWQVFCEVEWISTEEGVFVLDARRVKMQRQEVGR